MKEKLEALLAFLRPRSRLMVITGAGISAGSGIPTYRDDNGEWQRSRPIQHQEFIDSEAYRRRYWARSAVGWPPVANAQPNRAHIALAALEELGKLSLLVTQNVDRLHQRAGHRAVVDLHGRLDRVICRSCGHIEERDAIQQQLLAQNPVLADVQATLAPDGDANVEDRLVEMIASPRCGQCDGVPMPDVVFYGGSVPKQRVADIKAVLAQSDGLLLVGSSMSVYSAFRFCRAAEVLNIPIVAINRGKTRADELLSLKLEGDCGEVLEWAVSQLA